MLLITTNTPEETQIWGEKLALYLCSGDVITLIGGLGAGKTTMAKGIGKGLGVKDEIGSPTFVLLKEYEGRLWVYHFDFYRIENPEEIYDLDCEEYFYGKGISIIEWAERAARLLPNEHLRVEIHWVSQTVRKINFIPFGERYNQLVMDIEGKSRVNKESGGVARKE